MSEIEVDLLAIHRGSVEAPAGCGKTELIVSALSRHSESKPVLVLTHTNAGVAALRHRLVKKNIPNERYRLITIDGWALRVLKTFPKRSGIGVHHLELHNLGVDYPAIKRVIAAFLTGRHIDDVIAASYSRLIVDEYQDCGPEQHSVVTHLASVLPTVVLGDPMQEIFNWTGAHPDWNGDVCAMFPPAGELRTPWRWKNVGTEELGEWLLAARVDLKIGRSIDIRKAPKEVKWIALDGVDDPRCQREACFTRSPERGGEVLILAGGSEKAVQRRIAKVTPGAITVEAVDLTDLTVFAEQLELDTPGSLRRALDFAYEVMNGIERDAIVNRVRILRAGTNRTPAEAWETAARRFDDTGSAEDLIHLLLALEHVPHARTYRPDILSACIRSLQTTGNGVSFLEAAKRVREQQRALGRRLPQKAVGSPLLLKGLEGDVAVILNAATLDRDPIKNRKNLYVAMTRGSRRLVICSPTPMIG